MVEGKIKVLLSKLGLDVHNRGIITVARELRDAGMEVIYIGNALPEEIIETAIQEDVDLIALSCLSGAHMYLFTEVVKQLRGKGINNVTVIGGGTIPREDIARLKEAGIKEVFLPGTPLREIIKWTKENVKPLQQA